MNICAFTGNLVRDPEMHTFTNSKKCRFTIAVNRQRAQADGTRLADFIPVSTWNKLAEACMEYLQKGSKVAVTGRLATNRYENEAGEKRTSFEIVAESVEFIGRTKKHNQDEADTAQPAPTADNDPAGFVQVYEDDLPF